MALRSLGIINTAREASSENSKSSMILSPTGNSQFELIIVYDVCLLFLALFWSSVDYLSIFPVKSDGAYYDQWSPSNLKQNASRTLQTIYARWAECIQLICWRNWLVASKALDMQHWELGRVSSRSFDNKFNVIYYLSQIKIDLRWKQKFQLSRRLESFRLSFFSEWCSSQWEALFHGIKPYFSRSSVQSLLYASAREILLQRQSCGSEAA